VRELFEKSGSLKTVRKNTVIIEAGEIPQYCYLVKKGRIIGYDYSSTGDEKTYTVILPHSLFLEADLIANQPSSVNFRAVRLSELICIDRQTILKQMANDFNFTLDIVKSISSKYFSTLNQAHMLKSHDAAWMLCNQLLEFSDCFGVPHNGKTMIREKINQEILSSLLGVSRMTIVRALEKFKKLGLIDKINGYYCICDMQRMRRYLETLDE
jgi:CRP/FNR family transcriptional regulator